MSHRSGSSHINNYDEVVAWKEAGKQKSETMRTEIPVLCKQGRGMRCVCFAFEDTVNNSREITLFASVYRVTQILTAFTSSQIRDRLSNGSLTECL
jgi:hypothetical protein